MGTRGLSDSATEGELGLLSDDDMRARTASGVVMLSLRGAGTRALGLLGYLVLARLLSPREFGIAAIGLTLTFLGQALSDTGVGSALVRLTGPPSRAQYAAAIGLQLALLLILVVPVAAWTLIAQSKASVVACLFMASLFPLSLRLPAVVANERALNFRPIAYAEVLEVLVYNLVAIGLVLAGLGVVSLALATIVKAAVGTSILNGRSSVGWVRPSRRLADIRGLMGFGLRVQAMTLLTEGRDQAINLLTLGLRGFSTLGLWAVANRLASVPAILFDALWQVSFPALSNALHSRERIVELLNRAAGAAAVVAGCAFLPLAMWGRDLTTLAFGARWGPAAAVFPAVAFGMAISTPVSVVATGYLLAAGAAGVLLRVTVAQAVVTVGATAGALALEGLRGLGYAAAIGALTEAFLLSRATRRDCGARLLRTTAGVVAAATVAYVAFSILAALITESHFGRLGIAVFCLAAFLGACTVVAPAGVALLRRGLSGGRAALRA